MTYNERRLEAIQLQNIITKIQKKYAPIGTNDKGNVNQYWANGVTNIYKNLKGGN